MSPGGKCERLDIHAPSRSGIILPGASLRVKPLLRVLMLSAWAAAVLVLPRSGRDQRRPSPHQQDVDLVGLEQRMKSEIRSALAEQRSQLVADIGTLLRVHAMHERQLQPSTLQAQMQLATLPSPPRLGTPVAILPPSHARLEQLPALFEARGSDSDGTARTAAADSTRAVIGSERRRHPSNAKRKRQVDGNGAGTAEQGGPPPSRSTRRKLS